MENYKQELDQLKKELNDRIDIAISKIDKPCFLLLINKFIHNERN